MSFTIVEGQPDSITCYYILTKRQQRSAILGEISERSYSYTEIKALFPEFTQQPHTIIQNISIADARRDQFIVGIPSRNRNNISRRGIFALLSLFDIGGLRSIKPYVKLAGNDTTIPPDGANCLDATTRKQQVMRYSRTSSLRELHTQEVKSMIDRLGLSTNRRICLRDTPYR